MAFLKAALVFTVFYVASQVEYVQATKDLKVRFSPHTYEVYEGIGTFLVEIVLDGKRPKGDIKVSYKTVEKEAKENEDFKPVSGTVVFKPDTNRQYVTITIVDDDKEEETETFSVHITEVKAVDSNDIVTVGNQKEALVKILDDDKQKKAA